MVFVLGALPIAFLIGRAIHETIGPPEVALFAVIAMLYVTFARGRLIGSSVMIHESQYPRVFAIVRRTCAAFGIPMPLIFVREDPNVPAVAMGFGEPYALVLSSHWIEHFEDDELAFVVGRELGHIAAGHTRYLSLLSINGKENPVIALVFGAWLRICDYTCDQVGLLVCGSLDAAIRAIAVSSFHHFGRKVNVAQFAEQGKEIATDPVLRLGEWIGAEPYATNRIARMKRFAASARFAALEEWFLRDVPAEPPELPKTGMVQVTKADCAGWWRRATAAGIDLVVVGAIVAALTGQQSVASVNVPQTQASPAPASSSPAHKSTANTRSTSSADDDSDDDSDGSTGSWSAQDQGFAIGIGRLRFTQNGPQLDTNNRFIAGLVGYIAGFATLAIYLAIMVGLVGQSLGMMITGVRVVTTDFRQPGIWRTLWRYALAWCLWVPIFLVSPLMRRVMLHDRWSGTRLITTERILARAAAATTASTAHSA